MMIAAERAELIRLVNSDLIAAGVRALDDQENEAERRNYFRIYFSGIDCLLSVLAGEILSVRNIRDFYDTRELAKLMECRYDEGTDSVLNVSAFQNTSDRIKFVIPKSAFLRNSDYVFPNTRGWQCFRKSVIKRNEITHPKSMSDYSVSIEEFEVLTHAQRWLREELLSQILT